VTVLCRITAIIANLQRIKKAKQSFLFSKSISHFSPKLYPLPCFCSSEFSFWAWNLWGWPKERLCRLLVSVCNLLGAKDFPTSLAVRARIHTAIFNDSVPPGLLKAFTRLRLSSTNHYSSTTLEMAAGCGRQKCNSVLVVSVASFL